MEIRHRRLERQESRGKCVAAFIEGAAVVASDVTLHASTDANVDSRGILPAIFSTIDYKSSANDVNNSVDAHIRTGQLSMPRARSALRRPTIPTSRCSP